MVDCFRLNGRTALVTGASRGLGAAMAQGLAEAGANVILHASREQPRKQAEAMAAACGVRTACVTADLASPVAAARLMDDAAAALGTPIDILVNNAGIIRRNAAIDYSDADWDEVIAVNLSSAFRVCRAAGAQMLARGSGAVVFLASAAADYVHGHVLVVDGGWMGR